MAKGNDMTMQRNEQVWELALRIEALNEVARVIGEDDGQPLGRALLHLVARVQEGFYDIERQVWEATREDLPSTPSLST